MEKLKPRMNVGEVMTDMRKRGCKVGYTNLVAGIDNGAYPFARLMKVSPNGRRQYLILRRDYEKWADEYLGGYTA